MALNDISIEQGTSWQTAWPITDEDGDPVDLTGYTANAQVRTRPRDTVILHEWDSEDDTILLTDSAVTLVVEPATSAAWTWKMGLYDIFITSGIGEVSRVSNGTVRVVKQVTR
jgi:hypothetical protein